MTLIALEEHVLPADLVAQVWPTPMAPEALTAKLVDVDQQRLRVMDDAGIDMQVLSVTAPGSQHVPAALAEGLSRALNDRCAELVAAHRDRFNALGTRPTRGPWCGDRGSQALDHRVGIVRCCHQRAHPGTHPGCIRVRRITHGHRGTRRSDLPAPHL